MDIIVDKPQLVRAVLLYLNKNFGNLTPMTNSEFPNSVFYVNSDNEVMMEYGEKVVVIHYKQIWSKIESLFHLEYKDIKSIMKVWSEETYKLEDVKPHYGQDVFKNRWKRLTN